jgi:hypothetical protein
MSMGKTGTFLFVVLLAGMLWPLGRIWEMWHCASGMAHCPTVQTGCRGYLPTLNATCPSCGRLWFDQAARIETDTERAFRWIPRSRYPTVFSEPRICALEGIYYRAFWRLQEPDAP